MSYLVQTLLIGIISALTYIFSPNSAVWIVWVGYLIFTVGLFFKGREYRKELKEGKKSDLSGAVVLPPATVTVFIVLVIFLFIEINKFHLLWVVPLIALAYETYFGKKTRSSFEEQLFQNSKNKTRK